MAASEMDKYPILNPKKKLAYRSARNRIDWIDAGYSCLFFKCRTSKTSFLVFFFSLIFYAITQKLYDNDDDHHHHCCLYSIVFMDKYFFTLKKIITLNLDYRTNIFLYYYFDYSAMCHIHFNWVDWAPNQYCCKFYAYFICHLLEIFLTIIHTKI